MTGLLSDPWFLAAAISSVLLVGLSKGGFGGAMGFVGVPLMALVISPVQAAAILLPIMIVMDVISLWTWRGFYDRRTLAVMLPGSLVGIAVGWYTAAVVTPDIVRLIVGAIAIVFVGQWLWKLALGRAEIAQPHNIARGSFWGALAGFTSFVAHVGGPPFQVYAMPLRLDPRIFTGTNAIFFAATNAIKLIPYFALGQFDATNLHASLALAPLAPVGTLAGAWLVRRMRPEIFYPFTYITVGLIAIKLVWDGAGLLLP